jgi:hypothetical protein
MNEARQETTVRGPMAVILAVLATWMLAECAQGYVVEPVIEQNIPAIAEHAARGGATTVPGVDCGGPCAEMWAQEQRPIQGQPGLQRTQREFRTFRSKALKVLPRLRVLGTVGLALGSFDLGWKIGTGIRTKLLKIGLPEPPQPKTSPAQGSLRFMARDRRSR